MGQDDKQIFQNYQQQCHIIHAFNAVLSRTQCSLFRISAANFQILPHHEFIYLLLSRDLCWLICMLVLYWLSWDTLILL